MSETLPDDLFPPTPPPGVPDRRRLEYVWDVLKYLYPHFFDDNSPSRIPDEDIEQAILEAVDARPKCLKPSMQRYAHAYYVAYLLDEGLKAAAGPGSPGITSGIVLSEREGDISRSYANPLAIGKSEEDLPPQSSWEKWKRLHDLCKYGSITTRFGQQWF